jgi:hypothetical protein
MVLPQRPGRRNGALVFPVIGALALAGLAVGVHHKRHDAVPFAMMVILNC